LLGRRKNSRHRQRRYERAEDGETLGPVFRPASGLVACPHRYRRGACLQPRWNRARHWQPRFGKAGQSQPDALGRRVASSFGQSRQILQDVGNVLSVAFAPDGSLLASGNENGEIKLWNPLTGNLQATVRGEAEQLRCVAFTPDGRNIVAAGKAKVIRIWDVVT